MVQDRIEEQKRLFEKACAIAMKEIPLHERGEMPLPGWWLRRKLNHAIKLLERVVQINSESWSSMWIIGMVYRRFRDDEKALFWFERAYQINPSQPDVAREAATCALNLGKHDTAITLAWRASQIAPADHGLRANLAVAYLLSGQLPEAEKAIEESLTGDPSDKVTQTVAAMIKHFIASNRTPPTTPAALTRYWRANRPR